MNKEKFFESFIRNLFQNFFHLEGKAPINSNIFIFNNTFILLTKGDIMLQVYYQFHQE